MLADFRTLEERDPRAFQLATRLIHELLTRQFIHAEDRGSAPLLNLLHRPELQRLIAEYFDVAGFRLVRRETEGWAGLLPDPERITPPRMRVDESIVLLVMRRLWEEALQSGEIVENGTTRTTVNEAYAAYQEIVAGSRRAAMSIGDFQNALKRLQRRAIVRMGELDTEAQDMDLDIRALVAAVTGDDFLASLEQVLGPDTKDPTADEAGLSE